MEKEVISHQPHLDHLFLKSLRSLALMGYDDTIS
jgi:hypothetical protein